MARSQDWTIRPAAPADTDAVLDLWRRAEATVSATDTPEDLRALVEGWPGNLILAADGSGAIVGSIIAGFDGWRGQLARLVVDPGYRRLGLGGQLVTAAELRLKALGAKRITALVESDHPLSMAFWDASDYTFHAAMRRFYKSLS